VAFSGIQWQALDPNHNQHNPVFPPRFPAQPFSTRAFPGAPEWLITPSPSRQSGAIGPDKTLRYSGFIKWAICFIVPISARPQTLPEAVLREGDLAGGLDAARVALEAVHPELHRVLAAAPASTAAPAPATATAATAPSSAATASAAAAATAAAAAASSAAAAISAAASSAATAAPSTAAAPARWFLRLKLSIHISAVIQRHAGLIALDIAAAAAAAAVGPATTHLALRVRVTLLRVRDLPHRTVRVFGQI